MRFEIRAGGAFLILIGLAGLSGVVFALGLVAGYEMARQTSPDTSQVASVYPLPNPPPGSQPSEAASPAEAMAEPSPAIAPPAPEKPPAKPPMTAANPPPPIAAPAPAPPAQTTPPPSVANAAATRAPIAKAPPESADAGSAMDHGGRSAIASAPARHKPYNIQIDAVMDRTNAQQMAAKLTRLGYRAYMVPTEIGDQTWWRVRVGPYDTQEEAAAAEQELRQRYRMSYHQQ
jgi:septal ring-binding cell division protein DamX